MPSTQILLKNRGFLFLKNGYKIIYLNILSHFSRRIPWDRLTSPDLGFTLFTDRWQSYDDDNRLLFHGL